MCDIGPSLSFNELCGCSFKVKTSWLVFRLLLWIFSVICLSLKPLHNSYLVSIAFLLICVSILVTKLKKISWNFINLFFSFILSIRYDDSTVSIKKMIYAFHFFWFIDAIEVLIYSSCVGMILSFILFVFMCKSFFRWWNFIWTCDFLLVEGEYEYFGVSLILAHS